MNKVPPSVADFLSGKRIIVAGVSRSGSAPANAIFRRLRDCGHEVIPVNPNAAHVEGQDCYPDVGSVPGPVDGVVVATHPSIAAEIARAALERGVRHIWFHRSFGSGSVAPEALQACRDRGVEPIEGGCPLMYCPPVDLGHRFIRWWLGKRRRVPTGAE
jgi:predicted CoA-binding protein